MEEAEIVYRYGGNAYLNLTNRCPCRCNFCIRNTSKGLGEGYHLWFQREPAWEEVKAAIDAFSFDGCHEIVFCGYGEPVMALPVLLQASAYLREKVDLPQRINTNGLGDLIWGRPVAKELAEALDIISVSLNMPDADSYVEVVHPSFGKPAFQAMLDFAQDCKKYGADVMFTVVDTIGEEAVEKCRVLADSMGIPLRVRTFTGE